MITTEYKIAYSEVLEILKHISKEEFNKVPKDMIAMFEANSSNENNFIYDANKTLQEQNVSETARAIIAILFRDYWATDIQKEKILVRQQEERNIIKEKMYDPNNLFKNKHATTEKEDTQEQQLVIYKESVLKKFFNKILNFFK